MEKFNDKAKCAKCGGKDIAVSYCDNPRPFRPCWLKSHIHGDKPHMDRHCRRCHYEWMEACLDDRRAVEGEVSRVRMDVRPTPVTREWQG